MNSYWFSWVMSYSILIAALIGIIRYRSIHSAYKPFIWIIWLGSLNEIISTLSIVSNRTNTVNSNIYVLIELLLFLYVFYRWRQLTKRSMLILLAFLSLIWITDNLIRHDLTTTNAVFRAFASFILAFLAIGQINILIVNEKKLLRNGRFIISLGMLIFFSYKSFVEVFYAIPYKMPDAFYQKLFAILIIINFISNILYAIASLCLPSKPAYTLRSS
jgi:hypothetical protein